MSAYRWIVYMACNGLPGTGSDPVRVDSLTAVRDAAEQYSMDMNYGDVSGFVYPYSSDAWDSAEEFRGTGNPFDYPTKVIERGPRGGLKLYNA